MGTPSRGVSWKRTAAFLTLPLYYIIFVVLVTPVLPTWPPWALWLTLLGFPASAVVTWGAIWLTIHEIT